VYEDLSGPPNYWTREQIDHNMFDTYSTIITSYSKFDEKSIMLYRTPGRWVHGGKPVGGWNSELSDIDKQYMRDVFYS
jgi:serralysin